MHKVLLSKMQAHSTEALSIVVSFLQRVSLNAGEVQARMTEAGVKGRSICVKLKRRKSDAPEPYKFLGHGPCDNVSRSVTLNRFTDSLQDIASEAKTLLKAMKVPATQMRGIGISVWPHLPFLPIVLKG